MPKSFMFIYSPLTSCLFVDVACFVSPSYQPDPNTILWKILLNLCWFWMHSTAVINNIGLFHFSFDSFFYLFIMFCLYTCVYVSVSASYPLLLCSLSARGFFPVHFPLDFMILFKWFFQPIHFTAWCITSNTLKS